MMPRWRNNQEEWEYSMFPEIESWDSDGYPYQLFNKIIRELPRVKKLV